MRCNKCGFENTNSAKFCSKCGNQLITIDKVSNDNNNHKYIIIGLIILIIILISSIGFLAFHENSKNNDVVVNEISDSSQNSNADLNQTQNPKSWVSIGSYSGSGSGSQTIDVPAGEIMIKLSAYPIKNYATNHLYVTGSNGESGGVDWGSKSAVETKSDSFTYTSSTPQTFTIDYYETVDWEVEFYSYQ